MNKYTNFFVQAVPAIAGAVVQVYALIDPEIRKRLEQDYPEKQHVMEFDRKLEVAGIPGSVVAVYRGTGSVYGITNLEEISFIK